MILRAGSRAQFCKSNLFFSHFRSLGSFLLLAFFLASVVVEVGAAETRPSITSERPAETSDAFFFLFADKQPVPDKQPRFHQVLRVVDGDTLEIELIGEVRLIGVDTPELYHPLKPVQFFAREASDLVKELVAGLPVRLEYDREKKDKYGRTLAYVYLSDGRCLNEEIIRRGYGFAYTRFPFKYLMKYRQLEAQARAKGLGLWANQGLDEFRWIINQGSVPYEIFEMANNWWGIRFKQYVKIRLNSEELLKEINNLRQWTNEFSDRDLRETLLSHSWLEIKE
ncbi:MAG TPA: thermonuclease family protein [Candidatus Saccharicenans sp.]|nr:thermonuclease family protein [Candidatus Saccharicenans sp.]HNS05201.1 thermonuclease family protein [Candidatus Saccharicenans sp.]